MQDFIALFRQATTFEQPYPYQTRLATGPWPEIVHVPTGLGKTAGVTLAWLYQRGIRADAVRVPPDPTSPRRLIWCLPMRVLVEQTVTNIRAWLLQLGLLGEPGEAGKIAVHTIMGGEPDLARATWAAHPEQEAILIGTQDMLLSRALMRGYGMSRYQWPVHYALLHNDALWVFDEVQLMGPALPTTTQLEAFRRDIGTAAPTSSVWVSATLREEWLDTVDFRPHRQAGLNRLELDEADRQSPGVRARECAPKTLQPALSRLQDGTKKGREDYIRNLAAEILEAHHPGEQTLVIVNRVERAQELYGALKGIEAECLLLHARFRPAERSALERRLHEPPSAPGRIVVATQAVEAGVDLDSRVLFTELAPWASLVQRFGRCNRVGRFDDALIHWIDLDEESGDLALPYTPETLAAARVQLEATPSASPADLPPVTEPRTITQVLRRRDLMELFNTDPDLSGFDVDISPYIRDTGTPQMQVFWRELDGADATSQPAPGREELCPASITQVRAHLTKNLPGARRRATGRDKPLAWRFDPLGGANREGAWTPIRNVEETRPGQTLMLNAADGGYDLERGFLPGAGGPVALTAEQGSEAAEGFGSERMSAIGRRVALPEHLADVAAAMTALAEALDLPQAQCEALIPAARWHDVGKAHEAFQRGIGFAPDSPGAPWAKSDHGRRPDYHVVRADGTRETRPGFRHELASALAWLEASDPELAPTLRDRIAYLIAAHHGRVRLGLRALPAEQEPPDPGTLFARGVWAGDRLPALEFDGTRMAPVRLRLDLMRLGTGEQGPSWAERTRRLLSELGPFRLAWEEALVRIADWRASRQEQRP
ncbi:type I-G CRISPR-associated helicase/endonuclease Cas3g [Alkalilimnicola ehrlichii]|uniref:type I-G CRISPR-associated helicase/endonuclease Cas3g n=1 Tax=Alkalilimnicola ehrlichii TaxID=351052 RepID=UPI003B9F1C38